MRDPNRIDAFMDELKVIWKEECPDWRYGKVGSKKRIGNIKIYKITSNPRK